MNVPNFVVTGGGGSTTVGSVVDCVFPGDCCMEVGVDWDGAELAAVADSAAQSLRHGINFYKFRSYSFILSQFVITTIFPLEKYQFKLFSVD